MKQLPTAKELRSIAQAKLAADRAAKEADLHEEAEALIGVWKDTAEMGDLSTIFHEEISDDAVALLRRLGYKINLSKPTGRGKQHFEISWAEDDLSTKD